MLRNLLILRFAILQAVTLAGIGVLAWQGYVAPLFLKDTSFISYGIAGLFALTWGWTLREVLSTSSALNEDKSVGRRATIEHERDKDIGKCAWLSDAPTWMVSLGLLGTVVGFLMALSSIDQDALATASGSQASVASFMGGMAVAINTTIVGAVCGLWTEVNVRLLKTALNTLWADRLTDTAFGQNMRALD